MKRFYVEFMMDESHGEATPVAIREDQVSSLTGAELKRLHISRRVIRDVFDEARELMRKHGLKPGGEVRPCADYRLDDQFFVTLVRYA
jgi:hypothetical protein